MASTVGPPLPPKHLMGSLWIWQCSRTDAWRRESHPASSAPGRQGEQEEALRLAPALLRRHRSRLRLRLTSPVAPAGLRTREHKAVTGSKDPEHGVSQETSPNPSGRTRPSPALCPILKGRPARLRSYHEKVTETPRPQGRPGPRWRGHAGSGMARWLLPCTRFCPCHPAAWTQEAVGQTVLPDGPSGKIRKNKSAFGIKPY